MRGVQARRIVVLAAAVVSMGWAQSISSLQSSQINGGPSNVTAITSGTNLQAGRFALYINGAFNVGNFVSVQWLNLATNAATTLNTPGSGGVTPTQITVEVPSALFATLVASPVQVKITVLETGGSASAFFTINPPLAAIQPFLPAGTVNVPYSAPFYTGGTAPIDAGQTNGSLPPGVTANLINVSGTPLQTGVYNFQTVATDFWGNLVQGNDDLEIVAVPTITQVAPGSSGTTSGPVTIVVDGANFVDAVVFGGQTLPGSQLQWRANGQVTPLATTFSNSTRLTAVAPGTLLAAPVSAGVAVQQPSPASSQVAPFAVLPPTISTIIPTGVPAGSNTTLMTVNGANFTTNGTNLPTVTVNGIVLATNFVNSAQLTASIPSTLLISPKLSPSVSVTANQNPSSAGQSVTFTAKVATPTSGTPTGTVTFKDGAAILTAGVAISAAGAATFTTSTLTAGSHGITVVYSGDADFAPNTSAMLAQVVIPGATGMTLSVTPEVPLLGSTATYEVTLTTATTPPQGSVAINEGATLLCTIASLTAGAGSSTGTCNVAYNNSDAAHGTGTHKLTAAFTPAPGFSSATAALSVTVVSATATASKPSSSNGDIYDYGFATTFTSIVSPNVANPAYGGVVNFYDGGVLVASATPSSTTGVATTPSVLLPAGSHSITAQYSGDFFYATSPVSAALPMTVNASSAKPYIVQVVNPGGGTSNSVPFFVLPPVLTTILPVAAPVGSAALSLGATGQNFSSGSQIVFNGTALATTFNNGSLSATVPSTLLTSAGVVNVSVTNSVGANTLPFSILSPALGAISPVSVLAGSAGVSLVVTGANFVPGSQVLFDGAALTTIFGSATSLTASVPTTLINAAKVATISVANPGLSGNVTTGLPFSVVGTLSIATTSLPQGTSGANYFAVVTARGGTPPYTWLATGYPPALSMNASTGALSGLLQASGTFTVNVVVTDAAKSSASAQFALAISPPPVTVTPSAGLPNGTVGVAYSGSVSATGGAGPYTFSLGGGSVPDGLSFSSAGFVTGTPKTPGRFTFVVVATDANGVTGSRDSSITIQPAPLIITGPTQTDPTVVGTPTTITFTGTGGVGPYRFTPCSAPPPGLTFSGGVLSGTPTTAGTFTFCLVIADSTGATVTKTNTLTITDTPPKVTLGGTLADAKVGVAYSAQITAGGGSGPYTYSGAGLPDGLTLSSSGAISGTPSTDGAFSFTASVTDSKAATASTTFSIKIAPADIVILTALLPDGVVGTPYSATLSASGGNKSYTWTISGLPDGLTATAAGVISGTPATAGKSTVTVNVQDSTGTASARRTTLILTILPATLVIGTGTPPNGTAGTAYSFAIQVSGGTAPFTYSATGLPAGLTISAAGVISGTPTAPGTSNIVVTVKDAAGITTTRGFTVTVGLPPAPPLNFSGVSDTANPLQQSRLAVSLGSPYPVDVVVTLTLTFAPDSGPDDPTIQFSSGGRSARITVPAGATAGATDVGIQTGSVAGLITITSQLQASGQEITPSPAPRRTIRIAATAPVIVTGSVTAVRNATGFTVSLSGYVTDREMTQAIFTFAGSNLTTTTLTVNIDAMFAQYFATPAAIATGSQFTFTQPFTVTGSTQSITSVTVTLVNRIGQSAAVTVNLN
ncbi:MAG: putative Ig domain-containing protein [Candidatus Solibacter sp.]